MYKQRHASCTKFLKTTRINPGDMRIFYKRAEVNIEKTIIKKTDMFDF